MVVSNSYLLLLHLYVAWLRWEETKLVVPIC